MDAIIATYLIITCIWFALGILGFSITLHELVDKKRNPEGYRDTVETKAQQFRWASKLLVGTPVSPIIISALLLHLLFYQFLFKKVLVNVRPYVGAAVEAWRS